MVVRGKSPAWGQGTEEERSVISKDRSRVPERAEGRRRAFWARSADSHQFCSCGPSPAELWSQREALDRPHCTGRSEAQGAMEQLTPDRVPKNPTAKRPPPSPPTHLCFCQSGVPVRVVGSGATGARKHLGSTLRACVCVRVWVRVVTSSMKTQRTQLQGHELAVTRQSRLWSLQACRPRASPPGAAPGPRAHEPLSKSSHSGSDTPSRGTDGMWQQLARFPTNQRLHSLLPQTCRKDTHPILPDAKMHPTLIRVWSPSPSQRPAMARECQRGLRHSAAWSTGGTEGPVLSQASCPVFRRCWKALRRAREEKQKQS
ncbi:uncharacterized protein LOC111746430 [Pteropus vampyrus]|uniref:Uncharacterized protein LOC111746430 n=1 Tax=Pteropus vampyrus TaxID=132908 RepID=A0A6P6D044_PTEVA|nr:uncharacterized protein LOC111746430 [Pteropus vampyrus]